MFRPQFCRALRAVAAALLVPAFAAATSVASAADTTAGRSTAADPTAAQAPFDPAALLNAQREALRKLSMLDGEWRGTVTVQVPGIGPKTMTHTERVGDLLDGGVKLIEGRSYEADGRTGFNAFAVVAFDPFKREYRFRSHSQGFYGDYSLQVRADGFAWEMQAGPATMRFTATVKDGRWVEIGERIEPGKPPAVIVEMDLRRIGDSAWPGAGAVSPTP